MSASTLASEMPPREQSAKQMKAGLVHADGLITSRGWKQLNKDTSPLERNALTWLTWLRKTFGHASDQGHDALSDKGVSALGRDVLGGHIQPPEAFEIAEETVDRERARERQLRRR